MRRRPGPPRLPHWGSGARAERIQALKPTALLVDALQSVGDFGQHRDDFPESTVTKGFAASVVLSAIGLVDSLARDLARKAS